jgi:hypothetical protein
MRSSETKSDSGPVTRRLMRPLAIAATLLLLRVSPPLLAHAPARRRAAPAERRAGALHLLLTQRRCNAPSWRRQVCARNWRKEVRQGIVPAIRVSTRYPRVHSAGKRVPKAQAEVEPVAWSVPRRPTYEALSALLISLRNHTYRKLSPLRHRSPISLRSTERALYVGRHVAGERYAKEDKKWSDIDSWRSHS